MLQDDVRGYDVKRKNFFLRFTPNAFVMAEQKSLYLKIIAKFRHLICMSSRIKDVLYTADNQSSGTTYTGCGSLPSFLFPLSSKMAFTLAEVLITLGIIGTVAAMTIPTIVKNIDDFQYKSALKKNYSILSGVYSSIQQENSTFQDGLTECTSVDKHTCFKNILKTHLRYAKECDSAATLGVCFPQVIYQMNGNVAPESDFHGGEAAGLILSDGTMVQIWLDGAICPEPRGSISGECGWVTIDVNGFKKPNQWGKDIYNFMFYKDKLRPTGSEGDGSHCSEDYGYGCAAKYLYQ